MGYGTVVGALLEFFLILRIYLNHYPKRPIMETAPFSNCSYDLPRGLDSAHIKVGCRWQGVDIGMVS